MGFDSNWAVLPDADSRLDQQGLGRGVVAADGVEFLSGGLQLVGEVGVET